MCCFLIGSQGRGSSASCTLQIMDYCCILLGLAMGCQNARELKTAIHLHHPFVFQGILSLAVNRSKRFVQRLPLFEFCVCINPSDPDAELKWGDWYHEEPFCSKQVSFYNRIFPLQTYPFASRTLQLQTPGRQNTRLCPSQTLPAPCPGFPARLHTCFCWDIRPV